MQWSALCRSRRELSNAYLRAKFGFDTAENEPSKVYGSELREDPARSSRHLGGSVKTMMIRTGGSVIIITGPNENSKKASISVYVLAANSQDEVYEGTTRPRPEKRQANTKTRRRDE